MNKPFDVLVAGEINPDLILSGNIEPAFGQVEKLIDSADLEIGSSSAIFACGATRLGLKVTFIGVVGDDLFGRFMLESMSKKGVDVSPVIIDQTRQTGLSVILNRSNDRATLTYPGCIAALRPDDIGDDLLKSSRHLHIASYFLQTALQPGLLALFQRARVLGLTTSLDPNWDPAGKWHSINELLPMVDIFLPNENEALALTGASGVDDALRQLSRLSRTVTVKLGRQGGKACRDEEFVRSPASMVHVVDTIGAGDTFDAGFIYAALNGWELLRCLKLAIVCGSLSTRAAGGTAGQPAIAEALYAMDGL
jgi:sugar/nucleoside kinase (ribokinase family)